MTEHYYWLEDGKRSHLPGVAQRLQNETDPNGFDLGDFLIKLGFTPLDDSQLDGRATKSTPKITLYATDSHHPVWIAPEVQAAFCVLWEYPGSSFFMIFTPTIFDAIDAMEYIDRYERILGSVEKHRADR